MVTMNKVKRDYAGNEIWASNKCFVAKERTPVLFQRTSTSHYRRLGNMLVNKTSGGTGYIAKLPVVTKSEPEPKPYSFAWTVRHLNK